MNCQQGSLSPKLFVTNCWGFSQGALQVRVSHLSAVFCQVFHYDIVLVMQVALDKSVCYENRLPHL